MGERLSLLAGSVRVAHFYASTLGHAERSAFDGLKPHRNATMLCYADQIGEIVGVERTAIKFEADNGKGSLTIGDVADATIEPFIAKDGSVATLSNTLFSGAPGATTLLGRAPHFRAKHDGVGVDVNLSNHSAIESVFSFQG